MKHLIPTLALALAACGSTSTTADAGPQAVELRFKAKVGAKDFACSQTYQLGTTATQYKPRDFRLYVSEVVLTTHGGAQVPLTLTDDGVWQRAGVAFLDFEDKQGDCSNGTEATNTVVKGTAPADHYHQVAFTVGVPFEQNHQDAAAAQAPLNSTAMFWNWLGGYKFLKIDGTTTGQPMGHNFHVGSTGCTPGATPNSVTSCANPNRARVTLDLSPDTGAVVLDLEALMAGSDLDANLAMSAPGCMSTPTDTDCAPLFSRLGLPFGGAAAGTPSFFKVE